jgi:hypothetical protein
MSPYYPTIDEDLKRADEILAKGDARDEFLADFPTVTDADRERLAKTAGGTIYGADIYAAYMLLKSFVEHIRYNHQQLDACHNQIERLERFKRRAIKLNKKAAERIAALEYIAAQMTKSE